MNRAVVFETPGLIDVRSLTVMGLSAKPGTKSPIGRFGTGLKYACAVLARRGIPVTLWRGREPHVFFARPIQFRGREVGQLHMRRRRGATARWMSTELPFTTELGGHWEPWMALRELEANTRDEGGRSYFAEAGGTPEAGREGHTRIVVEGEAFAQVYDRLGEVFLSGATADGSGGTALAGVERLPRPSGHAYYRGMRVMDLPRRSLWSWNVTAEMSLTEDRTLQHQIMFTYHVTRHCMQLTDPALLMELMRAPDDSWEAELPWNYALESWGHAMTPEFVQAAREWGGKRAHVVVVHADRQAAAANVPRDDWREEVLAALKSMNEDRIGRECVKHRAPLQLVLEEDVRRSPHAAVAAEEETW